MKDLNNIFQILLILSFNKGVYCDDGLAELVVASTVTGVLFLLLLALAILFAFWADYYKKSQARRGRHKVPRSWLDHERLAKQAKKEKLKQLKKAQRKSGDLKQNTADMDMQYMHRSRPQIPGSWRREGQQSNRYATNEVPILQKTIMVDGQPMQPVYVRVDKNDNAIYQPGSLPVTEIRYSSLGNTSMEVPMSTHLDLDNSSSSSSSTNSTLKVSDQRRFRGLNNGDEEVIEASIDFTNDGAIGDDYQLQERVTAF